MSDEMKQDIGILKAHTLRATKSRRKIAIQVVGIDARLQRIETKLDNFGAKLSKLDEINARLISFAGDVESARKMRAFNDASFAEHREILQNHEARLVRLDEERRGKSHDA